MEKHGKEKQVCMVLIYFLMIVSWVLPIFALNIVDKASVIECSTLEDIEKKIDENRYPGYKEKLLTLKKKNLNWEFTLYQTGIDWKDAISNESKGLHGRSLVQNKTGEWLCDTCTTKVYDAGGWMCASEKAVAYMMDPRNYLTESNIFQFEKLSYTPNSYTIEGIEKVLKGTFMYQKKIREYYQDSQFANITFAEAIMEAANMSGASPYYLAARIRQEIGTNGSASIYGTYKGFEGYYNFYNIGANSGVEPIKNGLTFASNTTLGKYLLPWDDPIKAIKGGAIWIASNYIAVGQNTLYFQKFDVVKNGTSFYTHQYMQNIFAAQKEGYTTYLAYKEMRLLDNNYHFVIPVYENMPKATASNPEDELNEKVYVNASNVIVRKNPGVTSARVTILSKNTEVTRIQRKVQNVNGYDWDKVRLTNGVEGYIASSYLSDRKVENVAAKTTSNSSSSTVKKAKTTKRVNVRSKPGTASKKIMTVKKGTKVTILQKKVTYKNKYYWDKVKLSNGKVGYIASKYIKS